MRGNLKEFEISSLLNWLELEQQTGILYIETQSCLLDINTNNCNSIPIFSPRIWYIFFINGKITYASEETNDDSELTRIRDYLSYYHLENLTSYENNIPKDLNNTQEYNYLVYLLQKKLISPRQSQAILYKMIKETLFELLNSAQEKFVFKVCPASYMSLAEIEISSLLSTVKYSLRIWKQFFPYIRSPYQFLILQNEDQIDQVFSAQAHLTLSNWIDRKASLLQLSRQLNCQLVDLAKALYPYIKKGFVSLKDHNYQNLLKLSTTNFREKPHIVCVDNDVAIGKKVEYILKRRGYQFTVFTDSIQALTGILQIKPDLVFCQIDLPQINGNELCSMLKNSQVCRQTKVIMLSAKEKFSDRIKARIISSDDYLSLPFTTNELLVLIEKHLGNKQLNNWALTKEWSVKNN
jgi:twitching motility two-component system response regulator PilG